MSACRPAPKKGFWGTQAQVQRTAGMGDREQAGSVLCCLSWGCMATSHNGEMGAGGSIGGTSPPQVGGREARGFLVAMGMWTLVCLWGNVTVLCAFCPFRNLSLARSDQGKYVHIWSWPLHIGSLEWLGEHNLPE